MDICKNNNVTIKKRGNEITLSIIGDFDSTTTPLIHECCKKVQKDDDLKKVVLDFDRVNRVDTTAFACIINFMKEHVKSDVQIFVVNLHDPEKNLLEILKIEKIIKVV
jgi:anti-anti-sigma factor